VAAELVARRVAEHGACDRESGREPRVERPEAGENAGGEDDRAAGNDGADDGERFEKRRREDDRERPARMRGERFDQRLEMRFQARETLGLVNAHCGARSRYAHAAAAGRSRRQRPRVAITCA
jgi:hypothetical protein